MAINLLPQDLSIKSSYIKLSSMLKKITALGTIVFVLLGLGAGIFYITQANALSKREETHDQLSDEFAALEASEQRLYFLKSRLSLVTQIRTTSDVNDKVDRFTQLVELLPESASLTSVDIDTNKSEITVQILDSGELVQFMSNLRSEAIYDSIVLDNFSLSQLNGYIISFTAK